AHQGVDLALLDLEVSVSKCVHRSEVLVDAAKLEEGHQPARRKRSRKTAKMRIAPVTTPCQKEDTCSRSRPLLMTAISSAPISAPTTLPLPPVKLTPPSSTAAITWSSSPVPVWGVAEEIRPVYITAARPTNTPLIA